MKMMYFDDCPCFTISFHGIHAANAAGGSVNTKAQQAVSRIALPFADQGKADPAFKQSFLPRRQCFRGRILSVEFCHGGEDGNDKFTASAAQDFVGEPAFNPALFCCD